MTLTIVLFVLVLLGFVMFGYGMNKKKNAHKEDAMRSGEQIREEGRDR
jgi:cbb3-type cytochrome oxidase subunit 3